MPAADARSRFMNLLRNTLASKKRRETAPGLAMIVPFGRIADGWKLIPNQHFAVHFFHQTAANSLNMGTCCDRATGGPLSRS
jgi:hypothetical protein